MITLVDTKSREYEVYVSTSRMRSLEARNGGFWHSMYIASET